MHTESKPDPMNVLAVVAHPDDEILGCGATLARLRSEGHRISSVVLCGGARARSGRPSDLDRIAAESAAMVGIEDTISCDFPNIRFNSVPHIEIVQAIEEAIRKFRPEWVFAHFGWDLNIDHRVAHEATMAACMLPQRLSADIDPHLVRKVLLCEVVSSTDWAPHGWPAFQPNTFFGVSGTFDAKIRALEHFEGAMKPFPHSRSIENVRHLAHVRGAQIGVPLAEAFITVRDVLP
jgi:N-acetylglucosamine malate deacetylase 1